MADNFFSNGHVNGSARATNGPTSHDLDNRGRDNRSRDTDLRTLERGDRSDEQLEKVRDLLFGDQTRQWEARLSTLETRLGTLESKLDALSHQVDNKRRVEMTTLAEGVDELGRHIRRLTQT